MKPQTLKHILAERSIEPREGVYSIPAEQIVMLHIGRDGGLTSIGGVVKLKLGDECFLAETKKGTQSYLEYDLLMAISFEPKEIADRQAGFF